MKTTFISFIVFLFLEISCQNIDYIIINSKSDSCKVLDLDPVFKQHIFSINDIVDTIKAISLETTSLSILSNVDLIKMVGDYIIIKDDFRNGNIAIFDISGKFVCRLPHGNGPHEINTVRSFDIDEQYLYTLQSEKVNKYTLKGEFIESYPILEMYEMLFNGIKAIDGGFLLSVHPCDSRLNKYEIVHTDKDFKKKKLFVFEHYFVGYSGREDFMMLQNNVVFFPTMSNTIYQFDGNIFKPLYELNYPSYANTFETNPDCSGGGSPNFIEKHCIDNKFFPKGKIFKSSDVLFLPFLDGYALFYVFLDSKSGKFRSGFLNSFEDDLPVWVLNNFRVEYTIDDFLVQILPTEYYLFEGSGIGGNNLEASVSKLQHISDEDKQKILNAKADDNPLIIMYKLKSIE